MKKIMRALVAGTAFTLLAASVHAAPYLPYTMSELRQEFPELQPGFNDEKLYEVVRLNTESSMEKELGLHPGWTGDEYARAYAQKRLTTIRQEYQVGPDFTRDQLIEISAASVLNSFISHRGMPAHFSQADLLRAEGRKAAVEVGFKDQKEPLGAKEYAILAGKASDEAYAREWNLSAHWTLEELRATAGPERATRLARSKGIKAGMTHAQIVEALGRSATAVYAETLKIPINFTVDEAVQGGGARALGNVRERFNDKGTDQINEDWVLKHARAEALIDIRRRYPGLQGNFTEQQLGDYIAKRADADMRENYGFEGPYEEYDVVKAIADSLLADIRNKFKLPLHFNEEQLNAAMLAYPLP